jgi:hypothetical protein
MSRRRVWSIVIAVTLIAALTVASPTIRSSGPATELAEATSGVVADDGPVDGVLVSRTLFRHAGAAILMPANTNDDVRRRAKAAARRYDTPTLAVSPARRAAVRAELARLAPERVVVLGAASSVARGLTDALVTTDPDDLIEQHAAQRGTTLVYLGADASPDAAFTAEAAGAQVVRVPVDDPRSTGESVRMLREHPDATVRAFGTGFGDSRAFARQTRAARTQPELPGGGQLIFPGRRLVALYGSPGDPSLGPLGAQGAQASVERVDQLAAQYRPFSATPVVPAFEIIATVASSQPGPDGTYSSMIDPQRLRPWVQAAQDAGVYVTLDLQPGRADFLTQAKRYASLLAEPNVGLALDPEWRLKPDQVHLTQIGSVDVDEVNRTSAWLADLTRARGLPQKLLVVHEFDTDMVVGRDRLDTARPELQVVIHADGHGSPPVKKGTWQRVIADLPANVWLGWKNFYTEDTPTFSPARTMQVRPTPSFVSYQ